MLHAKILLRKISKIAFENRIRLRVEERQSNSRAKFLLSFPISNANFRRLIALSSPSTIAYSLSTLCSSFELFPLHSLCRREHGSIRAPTSTAKPPVFSVPAPDKPWRSDLSPACENPCQVDTDDVVWPSRCHAKQFQAVAGPHCPAKPRLD